MSAVAKPITNISCYQFAPLSGLKELRQELLALCKSLQLKGTILLSTEGINFFIAGAPEQVEQLIARLRQVPGLESIRPKHSPSDEQPFSRMLVRIKKEIITFGVESVDPSRYTSPRLAPQELKQWLDEGRPVVLLDTRNDYEVKLGTFRNAVPIRVDRFRDFPAAVRALPESLKQQPIVTFCTGGIRCEKAAPFMEQEGFQQVWQLDGGILKYFELCGGAHYDGECFVFDQRVGLDPGLEETGSTQCFACQTPLSEADQQDARYVVGKCCPYCFKTTEQQTQESIARREAIIRAAADPLPGSVPYENLRPVNVPEACDGMTLLDFLCTVMPGTPREDWLRRCEGGHIITHEGQALHAQHRVRAGDQYVHRMAATREPDVRADIRILHEDEAIAVIVKPAPLPMHPCGRFNRNTLQWFVHAAYAPQTPRAVHRLDANTTGLVLHARTRHFANLLRPQFERGEVTKRYLARVQGHPAEEAFSCDAPVSAEPGEGGSRCIDEADGLEARTEFRVLRRDADGTALLEARPITGRTNQIRVHLWQLGFPIQGDAMYRPDGQIEDQQTLPVDAPPLCLHAWKLEFRHPLTGKAMSFEAPAPAWA